MGLGIMQAGAMYLLSDIWNWDSDPGIGLCRVGLGMWSQVAAYGVVGNLGIQTHADWDQASGPALVESTPKQVTPLIRMVIPVVA